VLLHEVTASYYELGGGEELSALSDWKSAAGVRWVVFSACGHISSSK
jgi:hypothetical protein